MIGTIMSRDALERKMVGLLVRSFDPETLNHVDGLPIDKRLQLVVSAMRALHDRGEPVDEVTIGAHLRGIGRLEEAGGSEFIALLSEEGQP